jgi:hypothetical protein
MPHLKGTWGLVLTESGALCLNVWERLLHSLSSIFLLNKVRNSLVSHVTPVFGKYFSRVEAISRQKTKMCSGRRKLFISRKTFQQYFSLPISVNENVTVWGHLSNPGCSKEERRRWGEGDTSKSYGSCCKVLLAVFLTFYHFNIKNSSDLFSALHYTSLL